MLFLKIRTTLRERPPGVEADIINLLSHFVSTFFFAEYNKYEGGRCVLRFVFIYFVFLVLKKEGTRNVSVTLSTFFSKEKEGDMNSMYFYWELL